MKHILFLSFILLFASCDKDKEPEPDAAALIGTFEVPNDSNVKFTMYSDDGFASVLVDHYKRQFYIKNTSKGQGVNGIVTIGSFSVSLKTEAKGKDTYVYYKFSEKTQVKYSYQGAVKRVK